MNLVFFKNILSIFVFLQPFVAVPAGRTKECMALKPELSSIFIYSQWVCREIFFSWKALPKWVVWNSEV